MINVHQLKRTLDGRTQSLQQLLNKDIENVCYVCLAFVYLLGKTWVRKRGKKKTAKEL